MNLDLIIPAIFNKRDKKSSNYEIDIVSICAIDYLKQIQLAAITHPYFM